MCLTSLAPSLSKRHFVDSDTARGAIFSGNGLHEGPLKCYDLVVIAPKQRRRDVRTLQVGKY